MNLNADIGRTYRFIADKALYVKHGFGFGLSYTTWGYSDLRCANLMCSVTLQNIGSVDAEAVTQLYVRFKPSQKFALAGFRKTFVHAKSTVLVHLEVAERMLYYPTSEGVLIKCPGDVAVFVGEGQPGSPGVTTTLHQEMFSVK